MATPAITPIRQFALVGDNYAGRGSSDGAYIYIPTVTSGVASLGKYDLHGNLIWERSLSKGGASSTCSTSSDGMIFVASSSGGVAGKTSVLAKFNGSGDKLWEITDAYPTFSDVVVNGNMVYVGGGTGAGFNSANTAFIKAYALDTGTLLWSKTYPSSGAASIVDLEIVDENIYAAASLYGKQDFETGFAGRLDLDGNEIWWKKTPVNDWNATYSVRVVGNQLIGVGFKADGGDRGDIRLISFDKTNGSMLWDKSWGDNNQQGSSSVEVVNGKIYVAYGDGVAWNSSAVSGGYSVVDELDTSGNLLNTYKFDVPSANDGAGSLIKVGNSLYMLGSTNGTIQAQSNGGGYDVYLASVVVAPKPIIRGNSLYTIVDGPSWTQAEANSVKLGGHLAAIASKEENDWIVNTFKSAGNGTYAANAWIGLTDTAQEGNWVWSSGEKSQYFNWGNTGFGQEPNGGTTDNFAHILLDTPTQVVKDIGTWNDADGRGQVGGGISETPFIRRGDSAYVIVQGPTWEEAEANAVKLGGHLVTINDAVEWSWFKSEYTPSKGYAYKESFDFYPNGEVQLWVGVNDKQIEGQYAWISGESSTVPQAGLLRLGGGTPINDDYGVWQWEQGRIALYTNDTPPEWQASAKNIRGVAEIKLAPNNAPTGTPTLSGTIKAGQVLSIDKTPIQDADNFTGYTPTYNYSFEVSNDNGTTWTQLTSTDAKDNNTIYTITTAEVGKKVRGVVSYLDGYGTNESVASAASTNVIAHSNTAPTAVQTLTGINKVGRVITADKSTIVDLDGVPTAVSYGWEVSSNGTTWTKLMSADATDNNSTYALTTAELGKTVRSVISYTDQLVTNETVSSAPTSVVLAGAKPTGISLSKSTFAENVGPNVAVIKLSSVDLDTDDAYTYSLVTGSGSTDNSRFFIAGDQLVITGNPDFETKNSYSIRVRTTDLGGLFVDKSFTLKVTNVNEAPDAISLSDTDFQENIASGSVIASLTSRDPDKETAFTYSLTPNSLPSTFTDNQFFSIVNDQLKINASANFEQKDSYTISVRSTDAGKLFYDQVFTLVVQDVDEAPTDISITGTGIDEGAAVGSLVGSLVSTDQDESSTDFTYELVAGNKPNNNDQFEIVGDQLKAKSTFNFETKSSYVVNVRTTDDAGLTFAKSITIRVNNVNENPTDLTVSATAFNENVALGTTVATLGVLDPDKADTYSYSFVSGEGDKDNQAFLIAGNALKVNIATNFEVQKSYAVRLRVTDQGGLFFDKAVSLGVNNQVEKVSSAVSTTLAPDKDTLELTGTRNVFGTGNQFDNTIIGNSGRNKLVGGLGKDILTGGAGVDTFVYNDLKESLLSGFDVITDYASVEKINVGFQFEGDDLIASTGKASAFTEVAIGSVLSNTTFVANNAAAFTVEGLRGTFLALNDGRDGFQSDSDALIHLSNYIVGSKTPISII